MKRRTVSDDASAYGSEGKRTKSDPYISNDPIEQDEYPGGLPDDEDATELDEEYTDDPTEAEVADRRRGPSRVSELKSLELSTELHT